MSIHFSWDDAAKQKNRVEWHLADSSGRTTLIANEKTVKELRKPTEHVFKVEFHFGHICRMEYTPEEE